MRCRRWDPRRHRQVPKTCASANWAATPGPALSHATIPSRLVNWRAGPGSRAAEPGVAFEGVAERERVVVADRDGHAGDAAPRVVEVVGGEVELLSADQVRQWRLVDYVGEASGETRPATTDARRQPRHRPAIRRVIGASTPALARALGRRPRRTTAGSAPPAGAKERPHGGEAQHVEQAVEDRRLAGVVAHHLAASRSSIGLLLRLVATHHGERRQGDEHPLADVPDGPRRCRRRAGWKPSVASPSCALNARARRTPSFRRGWCTRGGGPDHDLPCGVGMVGHDIGGVGRHRQSTTSPRSRRGGSGRVAVDPDVGPAADDRGECQRCTVLHTEAPGRVHARAEQETRLVLCGSFEQGRHRCPWHAA